MMSAHNNSIFHIGWSLDSRYVLTGSGDQSGGVWDIEKQVGSLLNKHKGSVKCIKNSPISPSVYITAGRDGKLFIWDLRMYGESSVSHSIFEPVGEISQSTDMKTKNKKEPPSFTGFEFLPWGNVIVSVQSDEAEMRFWDMRKAKSAKEATKKIKKKSQSLGRVGPWTYRQKERLKEIKEENGKEKAFDFKMQNKIQQSGSGNSWISCMNNSLLVSSMSNCLYLYKDLLKLDTDPPIKFVGHRSSFYVKSCSDPAGRFVASGSNDGGLYIWDINYPDKPFMFHSGYGGELSCVDWSNGNELFIATSSDSSVVNFWDYSELRF